MKSTWKFKRANIRSNIVPVIVWFAALLVVIFMFSNKSKRFETIGIVEGEERSIAATVAGRIKTINFELYDKVEAGDVVVVVDTVLDRTSLELEIQAQREVILAQIQQLRAELETTRDKMLADHAERLDDLNQTARRYYLDIEDAKLAVIELKAQIEPSKIGLKELDLNLKIQQLAAASPDFTPQQRIEISYEQEKINTEIEALAKEIEENEKLLAQALENQKLTESRLEEFKVKENQMIFPSIELALKPIQEEINVQYKAIEQLHVQKPELEIRSPFKGVVSDIRRSIGEPIVEREAIIRVVEYEPSYIVVYIGDDQIGLVSQNMKVEILKRSYPQKVASSFVRQLGPRIELMPEQLWPNATLPRWGRPAIIPIPQGMEDLLPGELVAVRGI